MGLIYVLVILAKTMVTCIFATTIAGACILAVVSSGKADLPYISFSAVVPDEAFRYFSREKKEKQSTSIATAHFDEANLKPWLPVKLFLTAAGRPSPLASLR